MRNSVSQLDQREEGPCQEAGGVAARAVCAVDSEAVGGGLAIDGGPYRDRDRPSTIPLRRGQ